MEAATPSCRKPSGCARPCCCRPRHSDADVWVMVFDPDGAGNRALKQPYQIDQADYRYDQWTARIAESPASTTDPSRGAIKGGTPVARWRLYQPWPRATGRKLLTDRGYKARFPTAKTQVRHPLARFDGSVQLGDINLGVDRLDRERRRQLGPAAHARLRVRPGLRFRRVTRNPPWRSSPRRAAGRAALATAGHPFVLRHQGREFAVRSCFGAARHTRGVDRAVQWSFRAS